MGFYLGASEILWLVLDGVRDAVHSTAPLAADAEGEAPASGTQGSAAQSSELNTAFSPKQHKLLPKPFSSVFPSLASYKNSFPGHI